MSKRYLPLDGKIKVAELLKEEIEILPDDKGAKYCRYKDHDMTDARMATILNETELDGVSDWHVRSIRQQMFGRLRKPKEEKPTPLPLDGLASLAGMIAGYAKRLHDVENLVSEILRRTNALEGTAVWPRHHDGKTTTLTHGIPNDSPF